MSGYKIGWAGRIGLHVNKGLLNFHDTLSFYKADYNIQLFIVIGF